MLPINIDTFLARYQETFGLLKERQKEGLRQLLSFLAADPHLDDLRWAAYMLATVKHECGNEWRPIEEYSRGKGHGYGNPDAETGMIYYGRGYVQITHAANYVSLGRALNLDLYHKPGLALDPVNAYAIMSLGMRRGSFTGKRLKDYINGDGCDYLHARRIINGMDCAERIAGYAEKIAGALT